ncbi:MAG: hAT family dimerization domain-containing protein [Candidatus Saccharimonadales bacterium]
MVKLNQLVQLLNPFTVAVETLQGTKYPTLGLACYLHQCSYQFLKGITKPGDFNVNSLNPDVQEVRLELLKQIDGRFTLPNVAGQMALMLDPRFKSLDWLVDNVLHVKQIYRDCLQKLYTAEAPQDEDDIAEVREPAAKRFHAAFGLAAKPNKQSSEIDQYLNSYCPDITTQIDLDPLQWWKSNQHQFPVLARLAKRYLCIPASSAASETVFSTGAQMGGYNGKRSRMLTTRVCKMIFIKHNENVLDKLNSAKQDAFCILTCFASSSRTKCTYKKSHKFH